MRINYNVQAMNANLALNKADSKVSKSIGRLSSGLKIAAAKDEPSGYALSKRMNLQIEGLSRAIQSSNDAINIINIADGALQEVSDMINRISELAVKSATDTMTDEDRALCQDEITQLKQEIQRVADTTEFNGQTLLDGSFDLKGYTSDLNVKVATYSDETPVGKYTLPANIHLVWDGNELDSDATVNANDGTTIFPAPFPANTKVASADGTLLTITGDDDFSITLDLAKMVGSTALTSSPTIDITGLGAMDMQIGANEDQILDRKSVV